MAPGMAADCMTGRSYLFEDFRMPRGMLPDRKEDRLSALRLERSEHRRGVARPRAIIESQHHLARPQEIVALEVLETEAGTTGGVDLYDTGDTERVGIGATSRRAWGSRDGRSCARRGR